MPVAEATVNLAVLAGGLVIVEAAPFTGFTVNLSPEDAQASLTHARRVTAQAVEYLAGDTEAWPFNGEGSEPNLPNQVCLEFAAAIVASNCDIAVDDPYADYGEFNPIRDRILERFHVKQGVWRYTSCSPKLPQKT